MREVNRSPGELWDLINQRQIPPIDNTSAVLDGCIVLKEVAPCFNYTPQS